MPARWEPIRQKICSTGGRNSCGGLQKNDYWPKRRRRSFEARTWDEGHEAATQAMETRNEGIGEEDIILYRRSFVWIIIYVIKNVWWIECKFMKKSVAWLKLSHGCAALNPAFSARHSSTGTETTSTRSSISVFENESISHLWSHFLYSVQDAPWVTHSLNFSWSQHWRNGL
jgi:hypothetical protein